jgi:hypothetical protein
MTKTKTVTTTNVTTETDTSTSVKSIDTPVVESNAASTTNKPTMVTSPSISDSTKTVLSEVCAMTPEEYASKVTQERAAEEARLAAEKKRKEAEEARREAERAMPRWSMD